MLEPGVSCGDPGSDPVAFSTNPAAESPADVFVFGMPVLYSAVPVTESVIALIVTFE